MKKAKNPQLNEEEITPDIFHAAEVDNVPEMIAAMHLGQSVQDTKGDLLFTPVHVAAISGSLAFVRAAAKTGEVNPWIRDKNQRLAIDHAEAFGRTEIQSVLFNLMYSTNLDLDPRNGGNSTPVP